MDDATAQQRPLVATYRLQLHKDFGFRDATELLDHLTSLGISHVYTSPVLGAVPGSTHGYDVIDPEHPNDELGGEEGFRALVDGAHERGLGVVTDIVPNHMAAHQQNARWWDVLRFGRSSAYASWFDIDWRHGSDVTPDRLLLAVLGDHYGETLRSGVLTLDVDAEGRLVVRFYERGFPLSTSSVVEILGEVASSCADETLAAQVAELARADAADGDHADVVRRSEELSRRVGGERREDVRRVLATYNSEPERMHRILEQQHYRLAHWATGSELLDYRRFFDVSDLVGVQMQIDEVFESTHARTLQWLAAGDIDGVRIDHPDGLADPTGYLETLRRHAPGAWIVVEKILATDEQLPASWPVEGTTGYETLILLDRVFVDPQGDPALTELLARHGGITDDFETVHRVAKEDVIRQILIAEVHRLARDLIEYDRTLLDRVDMSDTDAREVISAFLVEFPVYRTYVRGGDAADEHDAGLIESVRAAVHARETFDPAMVDLVARVLLGPLDDEVAIRFRRRFQQTTGPVMAKGVEDTTFYRYPRLVSQNEVGGDPAAFGIDLADFHAAQSRAAAVEPQRMVTTSTHDTKRSEDVRARIAVLSEVPDAWAEAIEVLTRRAASIGGDDRELAVEYLLHQTFVGAWPISAERAVEYARKAAREAKRSTSWLHPDEEYEQRLFGSIPRWFEDAEYVAAIERLLDLIHVPGRINGLAEKLLTLTIPGVPDLYQGSEMWTGDLVDPDNRRPVDYARRRQVLAADTSAHLDLGDDGSAKLRVVRAALAARRRHPTAFSPPGGTYEAVLADGPAADHVVAFVRGGEVATIVPRFTARLARDGGWRATRIQLPAGRWSDVISGHGFEGSVAVADLLTPNPVALLERV